MSQTLLMFSLMLQPLLIQYVSNGCDKIAVRMMIYHICPTVVNSLSQGPFLTKFTKYALVLVSEKIRGLIRGRCDRIQ